VTATESIANGHAVASLETIRAQFPALQRKYNGLPVAYFDGPGGTQVPTMVADAMRDYLLHHNANTHWSYPTSVETDAMLDASRAALADLFNATPKDIVFGNNMTTLNFHLARSLSAWWKAGDEVVITDLDHHANVAPWQRLVKEKGIVLKHVDVHLDKGQLDWSSLERAITKKTKLLAIGAGSNALGTITDVAAAGRLAHAVGALVLVDAVHYAPHSLVDVHALDCDFLGVSAYKFYGPHAGIMFARSTIVEALDVPKLEPSPNYAPDRLETGTLNHEGMVGSGA
jgi:cysteine desulfurase family protein (TIGR01976 family)